MKGQSTVPALRLKKISKTYAESNVTANKDITVDIFPGEIFSIIGENGTGKSTLLNIISGEILPDSGNFHVYGREVSFSNPGEAHAAGVGMVHQHPRIVPELTVMENILLGSAGKSIFRLINKKKEREQITGIFNRLGIEINPDLSASELTSSQEIWVSLAGVLYNKCSLILLDESTSTMTDDEIIHFFKVLKSLTKEKMTIVFISHKLKEIIKYSDRIGIMKNGSIVSVYQPFETSTADLYNTLFPNAEPQPKSEEIPAKGEVLYRLTGCSYKHKNTYLIKDLSFEVHSGETLAITGQRESGLELIEDLITGLLPMSSGIVEFSGLKLINPDIHKLRQLGMSFIPTSRINRGSCLDAELWENLLVTSRESIHSAGIIKEKEIMDLTLAKIKSYQIKGNPKSKMAHLSGGNIQKVIAARELADNCRIVVFSEPSWGLDGHSKRMLYAKIDRIKRNGGAVIILSTDIEEVLAQSEKVLVIHNRRPFGLYDTNELDSRELGKLMFGIKKEEQTDE